jgi:hypothetical protein
MTKRLRLLLLAFATASSLAFAGSALAAFTPTLNVSAKPARTGVTSLTAVRVTVPRDDDALARVQIFVPSGYTATFGQAIGAEIGSVTAQVLVREPIAGAVLPITGTIRVADPAAVAASVTLCTGSPTHTALWVLVLSAAGQTLTVPVAVDQASPPVSAFASYLYTICLPNPNIPTSAGGATFGAKLINAQLNIRNIFGTPAGDGDFVWRAVATPWPNGAGAPVAANTREARAHITLPAVSTVGAKIAKKQVRGTRTVTVSGVVREQTHTIAGASVRITVGRSVKTVTTGANGSYKATFRLRKGRYTAAIRVSVPDRTAASPCSTAGPFAPIPCATETLAFYGESPVEGAPEADFTHLTASRAFRVK